MAVQRKQLLKNRIHRVGVELEGGWETLPKGFSASRIVHDGSVLIPLTSKPLHVGEIPSPVLEPTGYEEWIRTHYPQHVNETCGLHTHASFKTKIHYMRLMTPAFTPFIVKGLLSWAEEEKLAKSHPLWGRLLRKDHNHCAHIYLGDNQVKVLKKDYHSRGKLHSRYTALNYRWAQVVENGLGNVGTVECRLLSMMENADQAVRAVGEVFKLTNTFLAKERYKEPRREAKVALAPPTDSMFVGRI